MNTQDMNLLVAAAWLRLLRRLTVLDATFVAKFAAFTCFAPYANPKIAVGVIIQGGGYGATAAAPIAVQVIKAYLKATGNQ